MDDVGECVAGDWGGDKGAGGGVEVSVNMVALGSIAESVDYGVTASASWEGKGAKFLRITDIQDGQVAWSLVPWCDCSEREQSRYQLEAGDIVFARTGATTGKSFLIRECPESAVFASYLIRLRLGRTALPAFVSHYFRSQGYWAQISSNVRGVAQPGVNATTLKSLRIPLPSLEEQRRIAAILDQAETLRTQRRAALAQLDSLTQSVFLDMFGDPVANPNAWAVKPLSSLGKVVTGNTPSRDVAEYYGNAVEWIKSDNVNTPHYYLTEATEGLSDAGKAVGRVVPPKSILVTCIAGSPDCIGNAAMADREVAFNQQINAFVPIALDAHFAYAQIVVGKKLIQRASTNGMKGMVSKSRFEAIEFMVPPLPLQQTFATRIQAIASLKATHRSALAELDALFASLQQRAFAGEL